MKKLIKLLVVILLALLVYIGVSYIVHKPKTKDAFLRLPTPTVASAKDWSEEIDKLQTKLKQDASINVLEGTVDIEKTYTNKDGEGSGSRLKFLQNKLAELKSRSIHIESTYKFGYAFNLRDMQITDLGNGNIEIHIYKNDLYLKYLDEVSGNRQIKDEYGLFAKSFSTQEVSTIIDLTRVSVRNSVSSNTEIRNKAIEYAKSTIENVANTFGFNSVTVSIIDDGLIDSDEVEIKSINN